MKKRSKITTLLLGASIVFAAAMQPAIAQRDDGKWHHQLAPLTFS